MSLVPSKRLVVLAFAATAVALLAGLVPAAHLDGAWVAIDLALVALVAVDAVAGLRPRLAAERRAADIFSVGRPNPVTLVLTNRGDAAAIGTVMDDPIDDSSVTGLPAEFAIPAHASAQVRYEITPTRRGVRRLRAVTARYRLPLGLLERQESFILPHDVDVYPDVHRARSLEMLRRQGRDDARVGSLRVRGGDTEFERLRPWQRGDEIRHVDWRASARRDELVSRQYRAESNQNVVFALDIGRAMRGESGKGGLTSIDHALAAALLTADVALRSGDRAGLLTFDDRPRSFLRPTGGSVGGRKLTRAVHAVDAGLAATDYRSAMVFLKTQVKARSLFVLFTNVLDPRSAKDLSNAVRSLLPRHLPLCVLMRDQDVEELALTEPRGRPDLFVRAAAAEAIVWRDGIVRSLRGAGALVLDAPPDQVTPLLVKRYLEVKARRLL